MVKKTKQKTVEVSQDRFWQNQFLRTQQAADLPVAVVAEIKQVEGRSRGFSKVGGLLLLAGFVATCIGWYFMVGATPDLPAALTTIDIPGTLMDSLGLADASHEAPSHAPMIVMGVLAAVTVGSFIATLLGFMRNLMQPLMATCPVMLVIVAAMNALAPGNDTLLARIESYSDAKNFERVIDTLKDKSTNPAEIHYLSLQKRLLSNVDDKVIPTAKAIAQQQLKDVTKALITDESFVNIRPSPRAVYAIEKQVFGEAETPMARAYVEEATQESARRHQKWSWVRNIGTLVVFVGLGLSLVGRVFMKRVERIRDMAKLAFAPNNGIEE